MPGKLWGWLWLAIGFTFILIDPILRLIEIRVLGVHFPLGLLALAYGAMVVVYHQRKKVALELSPAELSQHGAALERAAPMIVDLIRRKVSVKEIAAVLERQEHLPREVTYKYIIALGKELQSQNPTSTAEAQDPAEVDPD